MAKYEGKSNVFCLLKFGNKDVEISSFVNADKSVGGVYFKNFTPDSDTPESDTDPSPIDFDKVSPQVIMEFTSVESIDVVINALSRCKNKLVSSKEQSI